MATPHRSRRPSSSASPSLGRASVQERVGILSRTLTSSSSIRWILPARIRSPSKNDVVFVGQTFIQLHEFQDSGQLVDTTAKLDFGTTITGAKIISAKVESLPIHDAILKQERDQEQFSIRDTPVHDGRPPQILVLVTRDNELIYVYANENTVGDVQLVFAKRPFAARDGRPGSECRIMAIEPESRALAVASSEYFIVFRLRHIDEIKSQIDGWDPLDPASFCPADEQRFSRVDGNILLMSFLPSPDSDPSRVILLLLVCSGQHENKTKQCLFKWDIHNPTQTMKPMTCSGRDLNENQLPTMLIPSTRPYSYMVVMPSSISYYENVQSSDMKRVNCQFVDDCKGKLEWVQWSRPRRHSQYLQRRDDIVILREDGLLRNFLIDKHSSTKFHTNNTIGHLGFSVDTAFCMLSGPPGKGGDIIIVSGSMTDGGVFHVSARGSPQRIQAIESLAPLNDLITGPPVAVDGQDIATQQGTPGRLYACSGPHDGRGQVSEIRYGLEAQIGWRMEFPDARLIDALFSLEIPGTAELLLLASHTTASSMVTFALETQEISFTDSETHPGFDFDHPTLAAIVVNRDTVVQVTTAGASAILVMAGDAITKLRQLRSKFEHAAFLDGDQAFVATRRDNTGFDLCLIEIDNAMPGQFKFVSRRELRLKYAPSSICCVKTKHGHLTIIGTTTGDLLGYDELLNLVFRRMVTDLTTDVSNVAISCLVALSPNSDGPTLLLCGLRAGALLCVELKSNRRGGLKIDVRCNEVFRLGATPVQIVQEKGRPGSFQAPSALVLCEYATHRVMLHSNAAVVDYTFSPLWVTDRTHSSIQPHIHAVHRIPRLESGSGQPGSFLICALESELLFCSVIAQEHGIARHLYFDGVPKRLLYSRFLQNFVVAFTREEWRWDATHKKPPNPTLLPDEIAPPDLQQSKINRIGVQLINRNLRFIDGKREENGTFSTNVTHDPYSDVVHDFIDWSPSDGVNHYEWLVLALEQPGIVPPGPGNGRVVCVNAKSLGKGRPEATPKIAYTNRWPVTAICAYKMSSLLIAAGKEIILRHLDWKTRRWETLARHPLPSVANAISCHGSLICIATQEHSVFVLEERNNKFHHHNCDTKMRFAKDIVVLDGATTVFASTDSNGTDVIGFSGMNKEDSEAIPLFHAKIPGHIHRFGLDTSHGPRRSERTRFYGGTIDGTLFHFSLLKQKEWRLLHFIEELSCMHRQPITAVPMNKQGSDGKVYQWKPPPFKPKNMHVRGDRLLMMIEEGPYNLRNVLNEPERLAVFKVLAEEVLGETEKPVEVVIAWMRKLLRYAP